jgi:hypothetical protein
VQEHFNFFTQQQFHQQQQRQWEESFNNLIPSATAMLTSSNFRQLVFMGTLPWLVLVCGTLL